MTAPIIFVTSTFPFGDGEAFLMPELRALKDLGVEPVLAPAGDVRRLTPPAGSRAMRATLPLDPRHRPNRREVRTAWSLLPKALRGARGALATAVRAAVLARVAQSSRARHLHAAWASGPAAATSVASALTDIPWSFSAHRHDIVENPAPMELLRTARFGRFISQDGLDEARRSWGWVPERSPVIHLGVDLPTNLAPWPRDPAVASIGALIPRKGQAMLIHALDGLPAVARALIAGDGPDRDRLQALAPGKDRVSFLGNLDHPALLALLVSGKVAVVAQTSEHEGIAVSLMEARAAGIPIVATNVGGTAELLEDAPDLLVPFGDEQALQQALKTLLGSPDRQREVAASGREVIEQKFNARRTSRDFHRLLSENLS